MNYQICPKCITLILVIELTFPSSLEELLVQKFNVSIVDDTIVEPTEQIELFLNTSQEGVLINAETRVATVYIFNDDSENQFNNSTKHNNIIAMLI